jgi:oxygen-independent coproporphyrinogen III oxidase
MNTAAVRAAAPASAAPVLGLKVPDADLLTRYDGLRIPRYTSYPTAPHFNAEVDDKVYRDWLGAVDPAAHAGSLYLHVPFCQQMCWYCGCHTKIVARYDPIGEYVDVLKREIALVSAALPGRLTVRHVHFGGGTPTMMSPDHFEGLIGYLRAHFDLAEDGEIAVEIDPRTFRPDMAKALGRAGVTRASLGMQDIDAEVQAAINRIQPLDMVRRAADQLRDAGVHEINLDLMYGLPRQTVASVVRAAEAALEMAPSRVSVFGYAHVPWMKTHQKKIVESELPGVHDRWEQFAAIAGTLTGPGGMAAIGLDHFARPDDDIAVMQAEGRLCRNFQGYTTDDADVLLGFGASSIGELPQGYVQNAVPFDQYAQAVNDGKLAVAKGLAVTDEDRLRRAVIERLMCDLSVDVGAIALKHGRPINYFDGVLAEMDDLVADHVAVVQGRRLSVPEPARPLMRVAAARFDAYLSTGAGRHSRAV